jgi:hypothetical protein
MPMGLTVGVGIARAPARSTVVARALSVLAHEGLVITAVASLSTALVVRLVGQVNQDAWLAFVAGREISAHGLPHTDTLAFWTQGSRWTDQQWLGQLMLFRAVSAGGLAAAAVLHALLTIGAYALAVVAARRLGGTSRGVLYVFPLCLWLLILGSWQVRTQSFSYLPFVAILWALARDRRRPSWRTLWVLPLLALWANVHGAVVLAAGIVVVYGASELVRARSGGSLATWLRASVLATAPLLMVLASPYGLELASYYRSTLLSQGFVALVREWQPMTLAPATAPFFLLVLAATVLIARRPRVLAPYEIGILGLTAFATLSSQRNQVWFALAALVLLPRFGAGSAGGVLTRATRRLNLGLVAVATAALAAALAWAATLPDSALESSYPDRAGKVVARAAAADSTLRIYADVHFADWLLWSHPELKGRIAFDARFELLDLAQLAAVYDFTEPTDGQRTSVLRKYGLIVLDPIDDRWVIRSLRRSQDAATIYQDRSVVVMRRRLALAQRIVLR